MYLVECSEGYYSPGSSALVLAVAPSPLNRPHRIGVCKEILTWFVFEDCHGRCNGCNVCAG